MEHHFTAHVRDAITLNRARRPIYAALSRGLSLRVSRRLLLLEHAVLPLARALDRQGGPLLAGAFAPMTGLPEPEVAPRWTSGGSLRAWWDAATLLAGQQLRIALPLARGELDDVVARCVATLGRLQGLEARHQVHLAMCRHLVESVARAAALAAAGRERGGRRLVGVQLLGLVLAPGVDRRAWPCHAVGVGVVVNDLPTCFVPPGVSGGGALR